MIHHPAEVVAVFRPKDRHVASADADTLATVRMWDENVLTLVVEKTIASAIKPGNKVLVDYRLVPVPAGAAKAATTTQRQAITKIISGEGADRIWREYRAYHERQRKAAQPHHAHQAAQPEQYIG